MDENSTFVKVILAMSVLFGFVVSGAVIFAQLYPQLCK